MTFANRACHVMDEENDQDCECALAHAFNPHWFSCCLEALKAECKDLVYFNVIKKA